MVTDTGRNLQGFFSDVPALICAKDTSVIAVNRAAACRPYYVNEGSRLSDHMRPFDILRFFALCDCGSYEQRAVFELHKFYGFCAASVTCDRVLGRRFAIVSLHRDAESAEREGIICTGRTVEKYPVEFLSALMSLPAFVDDNGGRGLIDLRIAAQRILRDIISYGVVFEKTVRLSENDEMRQFKCCPVPVTLGNLMQMMSAMIAAAGDISAFHPIDVKLCKYYDQAEIRVTADADYIGGGVRDFDSLVESVPSSAMYLLLCNYVAGCSGCTFEVVRSDDQKHIVLILTFAENDRKYLDFKSRDCLAGYEDAFSRTAAIVLSKEFILNTTATPEEE